MRHVGRALVAVLAAALAVSVAAAQTAMTPEQEGALRQGCSGDYFRLCGNFEPDSPGVRQCFSDHMKELSPACQSAIAALPKQGNKLRNR